MTKTESKPEPKPLIVSASQLDTWRLCHRKRWLEKVAKALTQNKGYFEFGTVLHAVCERWLGADDQGLVEGQPVDLYPEGWHIASDSGVAVSIAEQDLIKRLITAAIEEGVLRRLPGREVEAKFTRPLVEHDGEMIKITGFIDLILPGGVEDHKTLGNWKYAQTGKQLQTNSQVLIYAWELLQRLREQGKPIPDKLYLRHNQFGKDTAKPRVKSAEGWVTPAQVEEHMEQCRLDAVGILKDSKIERWDQVAGPTQVPGYACRKYGGCDFLDICTGEHDIEEHNELTEHLNEDRLRSRLSNNDAGDPAMSDTLTQMMSARSGGGTAATAPPPALNSGVDEVTDPDPLGLTETTVKPGTVAAMVAEAPWHYIDAEGKPCVACEKNPVRGISSKGSPCKICDSRQSKAGGITSEMYIIAPGLEPGTLVWEPNPTADFTKHDAKPEAGGGALEHGEEPVKASESVESDPPAAEEVVGEVEFEAPFPETATSATPVKSKQPAPARTKPAAKVAADTPISRSRGRPRQGFTLYIGCRPTKGARKDTVYLSTVLQGLISAIEADPNNFDSEGEPVSFWSMNTWARRDALLMNVAVLVDDFGTKDVVVDGNDLPEFANLVTALRGQVCNVVEGIAH